MVHVEAGAASAQVEVWVAYSPAPRQIDQVSLSLPLGSTVADALQHSGLLQRHALGEPEQLKVGIWTKPKPLDTVLRQHDRVEVYRPLKVDPKEARRQRYKRPGKAAPAGG